MKYSDDVAKSSENAYSRLAKAYTLTAEGMKHNACLRGYAEQIFKSSFSQYRLAANDYMYAVAHTLLGDYYYEEKRYADAIKSFKKAVSLGERPFLEYELEEAKNRWIMALIQQGKYKEAEKVLDGIRKTDTPTRTITGLKDAMCSRACIAIMKKDYATAQSLCKEADEQIPEIHEFDELLPAQCTA